MIHIKGLSFGYTKQKLFEGLDLELEPGSIYGLLGRNGAGKTTLLKLICGMRFPQAGECRVLQDPSERRLPRVLQEIALIPEELAIPPITGDMYELLYAPFYPRFDREAFGAYLVEFELRREARLTELSYGQKKKFLLAFAMASGTRILILDEPTNGLDIPSKSQFRRLLARAGDAGRLILISTHQVRDLENLIDPVIILDQGRIIFCRSMEAVQRRLTVRIERQPPGGEALFSEPVPTGYAVVRENTAGEETHMDLETLFKTVISSRERIGEIFARESVPQGGAG
jgi:ABC-2 type transport system ATP-binding protein